MADYDVFVPPDKARADYNIYRYTDQIYKIVRFKFSESLCIRLRDKPHEHYDCKLDASLSRSRRVVLELALCNDWRYFCTFTISSEKADRKDLSVWYPKFSQWLRDQRKKHGLSFPYLLVPEQHKDGSWHVHGLFGDISPFLVSFADLYSKGINVPLKLFKGGYYNWPDYQNKFGFCSFGLIKNKIAVAFYVSKYITKDLQDSSIGVGLHLYYCSRGLNRATFHGDVYGSCPYLDKFLVNHYDFCDTGMTSLQDGCDWTFGLDFMDVSPMQVFTADSLDDSTLGNFEDYFEAVQMVLDGF